MPSVDFDDHAIKLAFLDEIISAYESGNAIGDHYLNFAGGMQAVKNVLESKIGKPYGDAYVFVGFGIQLISRVEKVMTTDETEPINYEGSDNVGTTSDTNAVKLYPWEPWLNIVEQDRTNPDETELYDLPVVAHVRLQPVQYFLGNLHYDSSISYIYKTCRIRGDSKHWSEQEIDTPFSTPMPQNYSKAVEYSLERASISAKLKYEISDDKSEIALEAYASAKKQDGIWKFLWLDPERSPHHEGLILVRTNFLLKIYNPDKKAITVRFDFRQSINRPSSDKYDPNLWLEFFDADFLHYAELDNVEEAQKHDWRVEDSVADTSGTKEYKSQDTIIRLYINWHCSVLFGDHDEMSLENLQSSYSHNKSLDIKVLGLY